MFGSGKKKEQPEGLVWHDESVGGGSSVDTGQGMTWDEVCAWCLKAQGIDPDPNDSHGICAFHSEQLYQAYRQRKVR